MKSEFPLFRKWGEEEYWTTRIIHQQDAVFIIYEAGVLAIDGTLQVRWHKPKMLNDEFIAVERSAFKFVRDQQTEWFMRLEDGSTLE
jgi:hypothetical protein